jgi:hypothetical protein
LITVFQKKENPIFAAPNKFLSYWDIEASDPDLIGRVAGKKKVF